MQLHSLVDRVLIIILTTHIYPTLGILPETIRITKFSANFLLERQAGVRYGILSLVRLQHSLIGIHCVFSYNSGRCSPVASLYYRTNLRCFFSFSFIFRFFNVANTNRL